MGMSIPLPAAADIAMKQAQSALQGKQGQTLPNNGAPNKVDKSAKDFEAMFFSQMFSTMFEGMEVDPVFGGGQGEKMFRSLLTQEYGKKMSEGQSTPISGAIKEMMLKIQEQQTTKG